MKTLSKLEIINETVEFYTSDPSRRSVKIVVYGNPCYYNHPDGDKHCAFGRCMKDEYKSQGTHLIGNGSDINGLIYKLDKTIDDLLQPQYHGHDIVFWSRIQGFHDYRTFWDQDGLTDKGQEYVERLKKDFADETAN